MKISKSIYCLSIIFFCMKGISAQAQDSCKVLGKNISDSYIGECKKGVANGKGEAKGIHRYIGNFKFGLPNGQGTYYYSDSMYYQGNFQEGIKEGKGECHYQRKEKPDSVLKGYWSGDIYRGKSYITYKKNGGTYFDIFDIYPSDNSGNSITFNLFGNLFYDIKIEDVVSLKGNIVRKTSDFDAGNNISITYQILTFPENLQVLLTNGSSFNLELYKAANWNVRMFWNKTK